MKNRVTQKNLRGIQLREMPEKCQVINLWVIIISIQYSKLSWLNDHWNPGLTIETGTWPELVLSDQTVR